jgi:hypothetical protein
VSLEEAPHPNIAKVGSPKLGILAVDAGVCQQVAVTSGNALTSGIVKNSQWPTIKYGVLTFWRI